ncbi:hypothetical protein BKA70DRAFT_1279353 [Coprinopsis sp. MPI-PUGE-AT-0042]|nr:hypothetical protein BKA70DRAFT_1279353 [Coprinopsis sp. MPI-PUGE-AT-0042]
MVAFEENPRLLRHIRSFAVRFETSDRTLGLSTHCLSTVVTFFAKRLRSLRNILIYSRHRCSWKIFPEDAQLALATCVAENTDLTSFKVVGVSLPKAFSRLLPENLDTCFVKTVITQEVAVLEKYLSTRDAKAAKPAYLRLAEPPSRRKACWIYNQGDGFMGRLCYLDFAIQDMQALLNLLSLVGSHLKGLTLRHVNFPKQSLSSHHSNFSSLPAQSRFPVMPTLEHLRIVFHGEPMHLHYSCPRSIPRYATDYCTPSFASIISLRLDIQWSLVPTRGQPQSPILEYHPSPEKGFADLDNILSDPHVLSGLKKFRLNVMPVIRPPLEIDDCQTLRDWQVQREGLKVFEKTVERVEEFSVVSEGVV